MLSGCFCCHCCCASLGISLFLCCEIQDTSCEIHRFLFSTVVPRKKDWFLCLGLVLDSILKMRVKNQASEKCIGRIRCQGLLLWNLCWNFPPWEGLVSPHTPLTMGGPGQCLSPPAFHALLALWWRSSCPRILREEFGSRLLTWEGHAGWWCQLVTDTPTLRAKAKQCLLYSLVIPACPRRKMNGSFFPKLALLPLSVPSAPDSSQALFFCPLFSKNSLVPLKPLSPGLTHLYSLEIRRKMCLSSASVATFFFFASKNLFKPSLFAFLYFGCLSVQWSFIDTAKAACGTARLWTLKNNLK